MYELYNFGGQTVTKGSMWSWTITGYPSWLYPNPLGYNIVPYINGEPFNLIKYFQDVVGGIPADNTDLYFNDEGRVESSADATFQISVFYYNGRAFFSCSPGVYNAEQYCTWVRSCSNYTGCDPSDIRELDLNYANVWIYENTVPDDYTLNGSYPTPTVVSGDRWRVLMLGWAKNVENVSPDDFYQIDAGTEYSDHHVPSYNEGTGVQGGFYPVIPIGWIRYEDSHLPSFLFTEIETWEDVPQETGGGDGQWGFDGEADGIDDLQELDFQDLGFTSIFSPDKTQLKALSAILWDDDFLDAMAKSAVGNPMDAIISLTAVPLQLGSIKDTPELVYIGKYNTGIYMPPLIKSSIRIDFGKVSIPKKWNTAVDFSRSVEVFLPFIGWIQVNISEVMGGTIQLYYDINLLSGDFIAKLEIVNRWMGVKVPITVYQHNGNLQCAIPVTSINYSDYYKNRVGGAAQIMSALASGISGAMMGAAAGGPVGMAMGAAAGASAASGAVGGINQMLTPPTVARSGNLTGAGALMSLRKAKVVIRTPNQYMPASRVIKEKGMPSFYACKLKDVHGFAAIESDRLTGFTGTDEELIEFMALIKGGVWFPYEA